MQAVINALIIFLVMAFPGLVMSVHGLIRWGLDWVFTSVIILWWGTLVVLVLLLLGAIKW